MTQSVETFAAKFPEEISRAIDGLSGETERAVFVLLYDEEPLAFTQIKTRLSDEEEELHQTTLSNALSKLKKGGLVQKRVRDVDEETQFTSYYSVTEYGKRFLNSLFDSLGTAHGPSGRRQPVMSGASGLYDATAEMRDEMEGMIEANGR